MIQIKKSRAGREGDLLKVSRDENFAYSVDDYTPTVRMEDDGQGDADPFTQVLDIVKQGCKAQEAAERARVGLTREEVWRQLLGLMQGARGDRARVPSQKTVGRWLERWVEDGLMERDKRGVQGRGKPPIIYKVARALSLIGCPLDDNPPEFFQRSESPSDTETECPINEVVEAPAPEAAAQDASLSDTPNFVHKPNRVTEGDLGESRPRDIPTGTTRAPARGELEEVSPCWEAEDYPDSW